jgi:hypothetical protein
VLRDCRARYTERSRELTHTGRALREVREDRAPRRVGEGGEDAVEVAVNGNNLVTIVRHSGRPVKT